MVEASDTDFEINRDPRNRRGGDVDSKKRLNQKELKKRQSQQEKRVLQSKETETDTDIKAEFDDINREYQKKLEKKLKAEELAKKNEEKKELFEKDFVSLALGPEPKSENKKRTYEEKLQTLVNTKKTKKQQTDKNQRSALLSFLKQTIN